MFLRFLEDESGTIAIEYALIAAIIGIGALSALDSVNTSINGVDDTRGPGR